MKTSLVFPIAYTVTVLFVYVLENVFNFDFAPCGIFPRRIFGLPGILFSPFIHGDINHLLSNISALPVLMWLLTVLYKRNYIIIFSALYFLTGFSVWLFGRESFHIGASGIIYALASFIFFGGIVSHKNGAAAISLLVVLLYGGMVWGVLPTDGHISWESHLFGGVSGFVCAFIFAKDKPKKLKKDGDFDYQSPGFEHFSLTDNRYKININYSKKNETI